MFVKKVDSTISLVLLLSYFITAGILLRRIHTCLKECSDKHVLLSESARFFVTLTIPISLYHTWAHLSNFNKPKLQSQVVRILWMVPIFCMESYFSLVVAERAPYFQTLREIYEAFVIYCFMRFLLIYLEDGSNPHQHYEPLYNRLSNMPSSLGVHRAPCCCLTPWQMGMEFIKKCKTGVFQYVVVRFILAITSLVLHILGLFEEGNYSLWRPFIWMTTVNCISQSWALYSLFLFYQCSYKELFRMNPFAKFLCIKLIIFFSWWQGMVISFSLAMGRISEGHGHTPQQLAILIQSFLIIVEMFVASIAFFVAFPINEFLPQPRGKPSSIIRSPESTRKSEDVINNEQYEDYYFNTNHNAYEDPQPTIFQLQQPVKSESDAFLPNGGHSTVMKGKDRKPSLLNSIVTSPVKAVSTLQILLISSWRYVFPSNLPRFSATSIQKPNDASQQILTGESDSDINPIAKIISPQRTSTYPINAGDESDSNLSSENLHPKLLHNIESVNNYTPNYTHIPRNLASSMYDEPMERSNVLRANSQDNDSSMHSNDELSAKLRNDNKLQQMFVKIPLPQSDNSNCNRTKVVRSSTSVNHHHQDNNQRINDKIKDEVMEDGRKRSYSSRDLKQTKYDGGNAYYTAQYPIPMATLKPSMNQFRHKKESSPTNRNENNMKLSPTNTKNRGDVYRIRRNEVNSDELETRKELNSTHFHHKDRNAAFHPMGLSPEILHDKEGMIMMTDESPSDVDSKMKKDYKHRNTVLKALWISTMPTEYLKEDFLDLEHELIDLYSSIGMVIPHWNVRRFVKKGVNIDP